MGIGTRSPKPRSGVVARTGRYAILCSGRQCAVETEGFQAAGRACIYAVARLLQAARRRRGEGTPPYGAEQIRSVFLKPDVRNSVHPCRTEFRVR